METSDYKGDGSSSCQAKGKKSLVEEKLLCESGAAIRNLSE
jgi:hypothetical protein